MAETEDLRAEAVDADETEADRIAEIETLPRVSSVEVHARTTHVDPPKPVTGPKPDVTLVLKPFAPQRKRQMVTMSDMSMSGRPRGDSLASRNKKKPK